MWWAVDQLASEYGGGPRAILDGVYLDELLMLLPQINKRKVFEYKMMANIASVPHMDQKDRKGFYENLDKAIQKGPRKFDKVGFSALKMALNQNPRFVVK